MKEIKLDTRKCRQLLKWGRFFFLCKKCKNWKYLKQENDFIRTCANCKTKHSITYRTIFHDVRFGLLNAFRILLHDYSNSYQSKRCFIAKKYKISETTAGKFLKKIRTNDVQVEHWIFIYEYSDHQRVLKDYIKHSNKAIKKRFAKSWMDRV